MTISLARRQSAELTAETRACLAQKTRSIYRPGLDEVIRMSVAPDIWECMTDEELERVQALFMRALRR